LRLTQLQAWADPGIIPPAAHCYAPSAAGYWAITQ